MARYDLYSLVDGEILLVDVQADLLDQMATRAVVPLLPAEQTPTPVRKLNPVFDIGGRKYVMATQLLSAVPVRELTPRHHSLSPHQEQILGALEMLFHGF
ncbi:CcdB family protein [Kumtagia ephedrae]|jgi:toxin CcdB|uniref:Toxin CcdB n=1 Tax=Kumtagia ephedrae TaxID=2116701 RepID=A0A2P7S5F3_9HYPH|nr:CcdB family protein [Mesorhizobium ephedrae]PSJ57704.1 plasmid maintenance protein CcdB [Mesorhizobium ephedrae]